jgi:protein-S-isoprenylcysteine O-methyltransferase Ste14
MKPSLGKLLYGALFICILPALLILWTIKTEPAVSLPAIHSVSWGVTVALLGLLVMLTGMWALWRIGGGLPMNAYPPPRYVDRGIYGFVSHPIYIGFVLICGGAAVATGSASGLWLTTPVVAMACGALVLGYERLDMRKRFSGVELHNRFLPADDCLPPSNQDRIRCFLIVFLPWCVFYEAVVHLGVPRDAVVANRPFDFRLPVWQWTEVLYVSVYPIVLLVPFVISTRSALRRFCLRALVSMAIVFPIFLCIPLVSPPRLFVATSFWGNLLHWEQTVDSAAAAFPSYHVIWAFLAAGALGSKGRWQALVWSLWAMLVSISCITTGMHALIDVAAGLVLTAFLFHLEEFWFHLRKVSERIANSWKEWWIGPVRIIDHGAFAAAGVFAGILIIETCLGPEKKVIPLAIFAGGTIVAAFWAQVIEGSPALLRPLGFYGGLLGATVGAILAAAWTHTNIWLALSALCVAAPWIQGLGRLRCLVQGCCHGSPTIPEIGIRYSHPRSRVSRIPALRDVPIHATPLYSLLWNGLIALAVGRLYLLCANAAMIAGIYLMLSGLGRFVEEAYRGEPQTPILQRLRLYQWIALMTVVAGAILTTCTGAPVPVRPQFDSSALPVALICALAAWFVTGVDFPESNRRFARLT